jgi:hypothetical protein
MSISVIRKELFQRIRDIVPLVEEGLKYGVPHLVGEITSGEEPKVDVSVTVFENSHHKILLPDSGVLLFMFPVDTPNPRRLFLELWMFLNGKSNGDTLEPGSVIRGVLKNALEKRGFEVVWMTVNENAEGGYVGVLATKGGIRYRMTFEKRGGEFILLEKERT